MAVNENITISKGGYSVTIQATDGTAENIKNTLKIIDSSGGTNESNQSTGPKNTITVDLLRIQESYHIEGNIVASATGTADLKKDTGGTTAVSAKQSKDNLREIIKGAGIDGGEITIKYEGSSILGYIEDIVITPSYENINAVAGGYTGTDAAEYHVAVNFIKGVSYSNR